MGRLCHKIGLGVEGCGAVLAVVGAVVEHPAGFYTVPELGVQDPFEHLSGLRVIDGAGDLYPAVQVPGHQVRGGDIYGLALAPAEKIDPGVLQKPAHHAGDADVVCAAGNTRQEAANAPDDELDLYPCLGGIPELINDLPLGDRVGLDADIPLAAQPDLLVYAPQEHGLNAVGGDAELLVAAVQFIDQHIPEERGRILTDLVVGGHQA